MKITRYRWSRSSIVNEQFVVRVCRGLSPSCLFFSPPSLIGTLEAWNKIGKTVTNFQTLIINLVEFTFTICIFFVRMFT